MLTHYSLHLHPRYAFIKTCGSGGVGTVLQVRDRITEKIVAMKILENISEQGRQLFTSEFRTLSRLHHHALIDVYDFGLLPSGDPFFTMEYFDGVSIDHAFKKIAPHNRVERLRFFAREILDALAYVHAAGEVHGDVKPSNILVAGESVRLLDFGLSGLVRREKGISGTLEYMAPELIRGEMPGVASDIYALGAVFFELLTGEPPFVGAPDAILRAHVQELAPSVSAGNPAVPHALDDIIGRMLVKEPKRRWKECGEIARALQAAFNDDATYRATITDVRAWTPGTIVGRDVEMARLNESLNLARSSTNAVRIVGKRGAGATRLVREFAIERMLAGDTVSSLSCTDRTTVREAYSYIAGQADRHDLSIEDFAARAAEHLISQAAQKNVVVLIDDVDAAEQSVRTFLNDVVARLREHSGVLYVAVDRSTQESPLVYDSEITLSPLAPAAAALMIGERFAKADFIPALAARLVEITGGNIAMIVTTLQALERDGTIGFHSGAWQCATAASGIALPKDLGTSLRAAYGLDVLMAEPLTGDILRTVAFMPYGAPVDLLERVVQMAKGDVHDGLARLVESGVLDRVGVIDVRDSVFVFSSPALRDAAISRAEGQRTRNIHRAIAHRLRDTLHPATDFAEHLYLAGDYADAVQALESAGDEFRTLFAARQAVHSFSNAVNAARQAHATPAVVGGLLLKLASAAGMDGNRVAEGDAVQEAIVVAASAGDARLSARVALRDAEYLTAVGDLERAEHSAERGRVAARDAGDAALEGQCAAALAVSYQRRGDATRFLEHAESAVEIFRSANMPEDAASIQLDIGFTHALFLNQPDRALREFTDAKENFERAGAARGVARATGSIGLAHYMLGHYEDSLRALESAYAQFLTVGDQRGQTSALANQARSLLALRAYAKAVERATEAIAMAKKIRDRFAEQRSLETLGAAYDRLGQYERALTALTSGYKLAQEIGNRAAEASSLQLSGTVQLHRGNFDLAKRALEQARDIADALNETDARVLVRLYLAELAVRQTVPDAAAATLQIESAEELIAKGGRHGRESAILQLRAETALLNNNLIDARRFAAEALRAMADSPESYEEPHSVWLTHFTVFERSGDYATAKQSLDRAYTLLLTAADTITDPVFKQSYLDLVPENAAIVSAYRRMKAPPLNIMPAANELMLRRLYDISRALNSVLDLTEVLNRLVDNAIEVLHAERGLIFLYDAKEEKLTLSVARNVDAATIEDASKISEGILNDVFQRGKPVVTMNAGHDPRFKERASVVNFQLTTVFCVPMILRDRTIGSLYVDSRRAPTGDDESATTVEFLEAFANLAAVAIDNARMHGQLRDENQYLRQEVEERYAFSNIIGAAPSMKRVYELMRGAVRSDSPVMIEGESGTGKELVARAIHFNGARKLGKFVAVDCGALPETLLDSELFGHKKGAFTGAIDDKIGLFEEANSGTIFLDEITNTSTAFQAKLLRVIQEGEIRRVGDTTARSVDVRIIAATNKLLLDEIKAERFREDLYYRINVIPIRLPALRERTEDIPFLVDFFLKKYSERLQSPVKGVSGELMNVLINAEWHGNVRELENTIHRMLIYATGNTLSTKDLPPDFPYGSQPSSKSPVRVNISRSATMDEMQLQHITAVLKSTNGNKTEAARLLGVKRTTLIERMKRLKMM